MTDGKDALERFTRTAEEVLGWDTLYVPSTSTGHIAAGAITSAADELGFRWLGRYVFKALILTTRIPQEAWIDPQRIVVLTARRERPLGLIERTLSPFHLTTFFDDETLVTTWGREDPRFSRSEREWHRPGTGGLARDYRAHLVAIANHASSGRAPLVVDDLRTALTLRAHFEFRLQPEATRAYLSARRSITALLAGIAVLILLFVVRRAG